MRHFAIVLSFFLVLTLQKNPLTQSVMKVELALAAERIQVDIASPVNLIVTVENGTTENIQSVQFALANDQTQLTTERPLPVEIDANNAAIGIYRIDSIQAVSETLVGSLSFIQGGNQHIVVARTEVTLEEKTSIWRDFLLILLGAIVSLLGGLLAEVIKDYLERGKQKRQQVEKALSVLIPTLEVSIQAVENNRSAPIELWEEVYFKEGLYTALAERAKERHEATIMSQLSQLYAQLKLYKNDPQLVDRKALIALLQGALALLRKLV